MSASSPSRFGAYRGRSCPEISLSASQSGTLASSPRMPGSASAAAWAAITSGSCAGLPSAPVSVSQRAPGSPQASSHSTGSAPSSLVRVAASMVVFILPTILDPAALLAIRTFVCFNLCLTNICSLASYDKSRRPRPTTSISFFNNATFIAMKERDPQKSETTPFPGSADPAQPRLHPPGRSRTERRLGKRTGRSQAGT